MQKAVEIKNGVEARGSTPFFTFVRGFVERIFSQAGKI
jgi:hypothetical protein